MFSNSKMNSVIWVFWALQATPTLAISIFGLKSLRFCPTFSPSGFFIFFFNFELREREKETQSLLIMLGNEFHLFRTSSFLQFFSSFNFFCGSASLWREQDKNWPDRNDRIFKQKKCWRREWTTFLADRLLMKHYRKIYKNWINWRKVEAFKKWHSLSTMISTDWYFIFRSSKLNTCRKKKLEETWVFGIMIQDANMFIAVGVILSCNKTLSQIFKNGRG